jgi:hypothetical protein
LLLIMKLNYLEIFNYLINSTSTESVLKIGMVNIEDRYH